MFVRSTGPVVSPARPAFSSGAALVVASALLLAGAWLTVPLQGQVAVRNQGFVPFSDEPINYRGEVDDPVARLQKRINAGQIDLAFDLRHGYLSAVLAALHVPVSSQALVFTKTSFQYKHISPQTPRALYFNDDVYVGWVRDGKVLELISFDAHQGAVFYILDQQPSDRPVFQRAELDCTQCHVAKATRGVPGVLIRSIHATATGTQAGGAASFITGHESPLSERFGGWYVTGTHGRDTHMGNVVVRDRERPEQLDRRAGANLQTLAGIVDTSPYLTGHSDLVAQMVQAHQTQMHNLITLTNYQTRIALHTGAAPAEYEKPAEELVRYLLFVNEARFDAPVAGTSKFADEFASRGPRDRRGRSLREFDLQTRLFKYPCSYLIYSDAFDALPAPAKSYVYRRLFEILGGSDRRPELAELTMADRRAVFEILIATKPAFADEWRKHEATSRPH